MVKVYTDGYYDSEVVCLCCGNAWSGGVLWQKPFARGWRQQRIACAIEAFNREKGILL
jgi:hypothetical protein